MSDTNPTLPPTAPPDPLKADDPLSVAIDPAQGDSAAADQPPQKSPLDILEEILSDQKAKGGDPAAAGPPAAPPEEKPKNNEAELAKIHQMEVEQKSEDTAELQTKIQELRQLEQSPQYQNLNQQDEAADQKEATDTQEQAGFDIIQLDHTKIP